jgi:hypothetical protein
LDYITAEPAHLWTFSVARFQSLLNAASDQSEERMIRS